MNAQEKLKATAPGQPASELTRLKAVWRGMSDDARAYWSTLFTSDMSQASIRSELLAKLKINLRFDKQLNQFRDWTVAQAWRDQEAETASQDEQELASEHPEWDSDRLRQELLDRMKRRALKEGDFKLGLRAIAQDVKHDALQFDKEKFKEGMRSKLEAGLAELAQHIKGNPDAQAAYDALRATIKDVTA